MGTYVALLALAVKMHRDGAIEVHDEGEPWPFRPSLPCSALPLGNEVGAEVHAVAHPSIGQGCGSIVSSSGAHWSALLARCLGPAIFRAWIIITYLSDRHPNFAMASPPPSLPLKLDASPHILDSYFRPWEDFHGTDMTAREPQKCAAGSVVIWNETQLDGVHIQTLRTGAHILRNQATFYAMCHAICHRYASDRPALCSWLDGGRSTAAVHGMLETIPQL